MADQRACSVFTAVKGFSLDANAVYPLCSRSRPEHDSDIYSTALAYGDIAALSDKRSRENGETMLWV